MFFQTTSRREWLAGVTLGSLAAGVTSASESPESSPALEVSVFSKHLQWADWSEAAAFAAEIGFDGIDLTVRRGGHVHPERVAQDLPKAVAATHRAGLRTPMITTEIADAHSSHAESILRTAYGLGIRYYRWGGLRYDYQREIYSQLEDLKPRVAALAELNAKYGVCGMYHTHSGPRELGAPVWDIWMLMKDLDPQFIGINYDIGHATVEGGFGGWVDSSRLLRRHMRGLGLKDFRWSRNAAGTWFPEWCPPGQGMVDFAGFFKLARAAEFSGPVQLFFEYPALGGAEDGQTLLGISKQQLAAAMRRDLDFIRNVMRAAGFAQPLGNKRASHSNPLQN